MLSTTAFHGPGHMEFVPVNTPRGRTDRFDRWDSGDRATTSQDAAAPAGPPFPGGAELLVILRMIGIRSRSAPIEPLTRQTSLVDTVPAS
jgi:hypothetical protein